MGVDVSIREAVIRHAALCREALAAGKSRPQWEGGSLSRTFLSGANLSGANLRCADLIDADLTSADLDGANLNNAYLSGADLTGADLTCAYLDGAILTGAKGIIAAVQVGVEERTIYGVAGLNGAAPMFQAGCFWGTADELRAAITVRYADGSGIECLRAGYIAAVDFIVAALAAQEAT